MPARCNSDGGHSPTASSSDDVSVAWLHDGASARGESTFGAPVWSCCVGGDEHPVAKSTRLANPTNEQSKRMETKTRKSCAEARWLLLLERIRFELPTAGTESQRSLQSRGLTNVTGVRRLRPQQHLVGQRTSIADEAHVGMHLTLDRFDEL